MSLRNKKMRADDDVSDSEGAVDAFDPFPDPVTIPITDVFDLHTIQPRDVKLGS